MHTLYINNHIEVELKANLQIVILCYRPFYKKINYINLLFRQIGYRYILEMRSSWNFPARASPSCEVSEPSRAELGYFNFRAETELTILTIWMSTNSKFLTYLFPILLQYHDSNQFHVHLLELM